MRSCTCLSRATLAALPLVAVLAAAAGCGSSETAASGITVTGRILKDGQPIPVQPPSGAVLHLTMLDDADPNIMVSQGEYAPDGTFTFEGARGGKMRIVIRYTNEMEDAAKVMSQLSSDTQGDRMTLLDRYKSKFDEANTPVKIDVPADGGEVPDIDIGKYLKEFGLE